MMEMGKIDIAKIEAARRADGNGGVGRQPNIAATCYIGLRIKQSNNLVADGGPIVNAGGLPAREKIKAIMIRHGLVRLWQQK